MLQAELGDGCYVVEEGLGSRTTDLDYERKPGRNGRTYLEPCLDSHNPVDVVVLMLGTNDLKIEFDRSAEDIAQAIAGLVRLIQAKTAKYRGKPAQVVVVSPVLVNEHAAKIVEWYSAYYDSESAEKSRQLSELLAGVARDLECAFFDAARVANTGQDGIHIDESSHPRLGRALASVVDKLIV